MRSARYSGYRRLLDRMAAGILTTVEAMDTDPGAALATYVAYMARLAGRMRRQQKLRQRAWQREQARRRVQQEQPLTLGITPDLHRGMGTRLNRAKQMEKRELILHMALGVFDAAGVVRLALHREAVVANVSDLLLYSLDELEWIATEKGGIRRLLDEKWAKVYQAKSSRGLFRRHDLHTAA